MALAVAWLSPPLAVWLDAATLERVLRLAGVVLAGAAVYAGVLWASGLRPRQLARPAGQETR
jgi:peptidoglycan biosynthesis protein MviN/MurJ (putative lipid II flippase)